MCTWVCLGYLFTDSFPVVRPFVLITGTVITLILIVVGAIALLSEVGSQPLPSVLTSSAPPMSVKD